MPQRAGLLFSFALHIAVVALFFLHLPFFQRQIPEETPIVVDSSISRPRPARPRRP